MNHYRRVGPGPLLFVGFWLLLMIGGRSQLFRDPGTFWHTRTGDRILADGFFDTDPYSFTRAGERWVPHQWLGEVGLAVVHRTAGFDGLLLFAATGLAGLFTWLTLRLLGTGVHAILAVPVVGLGLAASATHFHVRPHLVTIVGMAVTAAVLTDFDAGRSRFRRLWLLVPVYLVWSNTHGGMLGGLVTLGLAGAGWVVARVVGWPSPLTSWRTAVGYAVVILGCAATAVVTPYGTGVPKAWLKIMSLGDLSRYVEEHAPLSAADPNAWPILALAGLYLFVLAGVRQRPRVTWLLPLFWLFQAYARVRHAPLFAVVTLIAVADLWPATAWARRFASRRPDLYDPAHSPASHPRVVWLIPIVLLVSSLVLQVAGVRVPVVGAGWARLDPARWPVGLVGPLRAHAPADGTPVHMFNDCEYGGFLIYHAPGYRVFFDDRFELYDGDMVREFVEAGAEGTAERMADWQGRYGRIDAALVNSGGGFDWYFRDRPGEWARVAGAGAATFYVRRDRGGNANGVR